MALFLDTEVNLDEAVKAVLIGTVYADLYPLLDFGFPAFNDHLVSGQTSLPLGDFGPGSSVQRARVRVRGEAFAGTLDKFFGTRVTAAPLVYDQNGAAAPSIPGQQAFVIDFGGVRSLLGLVMPQGVKAVLVLPWMGTDFARQPIYPISSTYAYHALPAADTAGKRQVGFPAIETAKLFVQLIGNLASEAAFAQQVRIVTSVLPQNLRASVSGRPAFFTKPGALDGEVELTGLAEELNAAVQGLDGAQLLTLDIVCDTPGALEVVYDAAQDLALQRSQAAQWGGRSSLDVALPALMATPLELVLPITDFADNSAPWQLRRLLLELGGSFPRWRAFGPPGPPAGRLSASVNSRFSVACRLALPGPVLLHGLELALQATAAAELRLELLPEVDGAPAAAAAPLAALDLKLTATGDAPTWQPALLATVLDTGAAAAIWLVLKGKSGHVAWWAASAAASVPPATLVAQEGGRWQRYPTRAGQAPAPLLRLLREPLPRENLPLITLQWNGTELSAQANPGSGAAALVELTFPGSTALAATPSAGAVTTTLTVTAAASGTLQVRSATAFHGS